jgi:hypothetical protein
MSLLCLVDIDLLYKDLLQVLVPIILNPENS